MSSFKIFFWPCHSKGQDPAIGRFLHFIKQTYEKKKTVEQQKRNGIFWWATSPQHRSVLFLFFLFFFFCDLDWLHFPTVLYIHSVSNFTVSNVLYLVWCGISNVFRVRNALLIRFIISIVIRTAIRHIFLYSEVSKL